MIRRSRHRAARFGGSVVGLFSLLTAVTLAAPPVPSERWIATSNTAMSITGDARYKPTSIGFSTGRILSIAYVKDVSGRVSFVGESHAKDFAKLYRVLTPHDLLLRNNNSFCGAKPTYITVMVVREGSGAAAYLTVYSGAAEPTGAKSDKICAGYAYSVLE
jgi:hypothetical protein